MGCPLWPSLGRTSSDPSRIRSVSDALSGSSTPTQAGLFSHQISTATAVSLLSVRPNFSSPTCLPNRSATYIASSQLFKSTKHLAVLQVVFCFGLRFSGFAFQPTLTRLNLPPRPTSNTLNPNEVVLLVAVFRSRDQLRSSSIPQGDFLRLTQVFSLLQVIGFHQKPRTHQPRETHLTSLISAT